MSTGPHIRPAGPGDLDRLVQTIVSAEKSGTDRLGLATLFGITEAEAVRYLASMLDEEVDGCELSVSSFLVAEQDGQFAGAVGGWVEGAPDDVPSGLVKSNLIGATYPEEAMTALRKNADVLKGLRFERELGALQIEYVHVDPAFRGKGVARSLINAHIERSTAMPSPPVKVQVQAFADNATAIRLYEQLGFSIVRTSISTHPDALRFLPFHQKVLMERTL